MKKPILIGITGGTGSGKTTIAEAIHSAFEGNSITMIMQDSYYKDQSHITFEERLKTNYDHPHSIDMDHLIRDLKSLMSGKSVDMPVYDFAEHTRKSETIHIVPTDIIIVEGILVLDDKNLRDLLDIKIIYPFLSLCQQLFAKYPKGFLGLYYEIGRASCRERV